MRSFAWLRTRRRTLISAGVVTVAAVGIAAAAVAYEGNPTTEVELNDGGVWVTKQSSLLVGHFNNESTLLDGGLRTVSDEYDILQSGDRVILVDPGAGTATTIDPAMVLLTDGTDIPGGSTVRLGGDTVAVLDASKGNLWVVPAAGLASFAAAETEPVAELGAGAAVAVGTDGTVYAASAENRELITVPVDAEGAPVEPRTSSLDAVADTPVLQVSAVGTTAVVLDTASGSLVSSSGLSTTIDAAAGARLQMPSAASDTVTVATADALVRVPFDGSDAVVTGATAEGAPAEPVYLEGCAYGVWSGSTAFVRDCIGDADDLVETVPGADPSGDLRFRVNRDVIVLNDIIGGSAWMAADDLRQVDNWNDITPPEGDSEENDEETTEETVETTLPERTDKNTEPEAVDDDFGVRAGRTTVLPVLDNDTDADGDILTVTLPDGGPSLGDVQSINNGAGLQISVPEGATGSARFTYQIDDGRTGTDTAVVELAVHDAGANDAPTQKRKTALAVEAGGVVTYNLLPDWIDPDGDDVFLLGVEPAPGDEVDFTPDGRITYRSINGAQGRKDIEITVSDGDKVGFGILRLDVRPPGTTDPVTNADHVVAYPGVPVTVSPLLNDIAPGAEPLRLTRVEEISGARVNPDYSDDTFTVESDTIGTRYVQYTASVGSKFAIGVVRVDVREKPDTDAPPIAVRDVALLPAAGEVLVDALANDVEPGGGVLVIQSVSVDRGLGITVSVVGHKTIRIGDQGALDRQVTVRYTISNGLHSADGEVVVIPVPGADKRRPPVANDDTAIVRAGDVVTIPVLDNDYDPGGDTLHLAEEFIEPLPEVEDGELFIAQDTVRFRAGDEPGTVYATYEVVDDSGQKDAGYITIQVLPVDAEANQAPRPRDVEARVLSGAMTDIPITLDGIDPDGDSVELVGIASAPSKGRIVETTGSSFSYEALGDSVGTDTFTYRVRDRLGKEATATIRVGVAPAASANQAPYAVKDAIVMRPGRIVAVPVLANDSDPDGDEVVMVKGAVITPDVDGLEAEVRGNRLVITSPGAEMETSVQYTIVDARGAEAIAAVQITVDEDVPLSRPIARDDRVAPEDVDGETVDVEVLANDEDPDGTVEALTVAVDDESATVLADGTVRITLDDEEKLLTYTLTDEDGLETAAFIRVPSIDGLPPTLISTEGIEVPSGETIEIPLAEHVRASGDRTAVITEAAKASAVHSDGGELVKDQTTLVYTSADRYYGQDAITFEVTDGTGPDDPKGRKATLTLPVTVLPPENQQPEFVDGSMDIAPGEEPAGLDLAALTSDIDEGDLEGMRYAVVGGMPDGFTASVDGQRLLVGASSDTEKGTSITLTLSITDGETDPIEGSVTVNVTASTRFLAVAVDDVVEEAHQGTTVMVPVLANDTINPFPETPLKLVSAVTETGVGFAEVQGDQVAVSPGEDFVGTMTVRYRIQDATKDPDREVEAIITLTVQGVPEAPGIPTVVSEQDRTVVLSWTPPIDNGAEITEYLVSSNRGTEHECASTTCTLDGLTNNVEYNFTVVAVNRVGPSDPSLPSEVARPDARPDTPAPPTLVFGDRSLQVAWTTPSTPGSPVEHYTLQISPAPPSGIAEKANITGNSYVWEGLENGTAYRVRVIAHNRAPDPSSPSVWSTTEIPATMPDPVAAPQTERLSPVGKQAQMRVTWAEPATNGDAISGYQLQVLRGGSVVRTISGIAGDQRAQAVVVDTSTTDYTFQVRASNKAGWGDWGAASSPRRAFVAPEAPTGVSASPGNNRITVSYTAPAGNGATAGELGYEYSLNGAAWNAMPGNRIITGLANGTDYKVRVRAYTAMDGVRYDGDPSAASAAAKPYGPVGTPGASASRSGQSIDYSWSAPATNGRAIQQVQIKYTGSGGWIDVANNGSRSVHYGYSKTGTIEVRAYDTEGQVSNVRSASATTVEEPKPRAWTSRGSSAQGMEGCSSAYCAYFVINVENWVAGNYTLNCNDTKGRWGNRTFYIPANGSVQLGCYSGYRGYTSWVSYSGPGGTGNAESVVW